MVNKINFLNKKIAILGFGVENKALLEWLLEKGAKSITICDKKNISILNYLKKIKKTKIKFQIGENYLDRLNNFDIIFRTPGIPYLTKEIQEAKKNKVIISSQTKLFFDLCKAKIIGVTGTKGKGTTSTLIYQMLKNSKKRVFLAGNIGNAPIKLIDNIRKEDIVILELSSFQLQDLDKSPDVSVVLNITSDHLDYHKNNAEYIEAKTNIVRHQGKKDFAIINLDYLTSFKFAAVSPGENDYYFSIRKSVDLGAFIKWNSKELDSKWGEIILRTEKKDYFVAKTYNIPIVGMHNLENILAAITTSFVAGAKMQAIKETITNFHGLEHRIEFVRKKLGVSYYNDSASTNPDTTIAAINSFKKQPIILIAGGSDKGANYDKLAKALIDNKINIKHLILMGITAQKIQNSIKKIKNKKNFLIKKVSNLKDAIKETRKVSKIGDIVLFSPASASFDMFVDYKDRGNKFKKIINSL